MGAATDTFTVDTAPEPLPTVNPTLQKPQYRGLVPWQPGQSGNPSGKPKDPQTLTGILAQLIDKHAIAERLWEIANGEKTRPELRLEAIKYIYARIEGSPVQAMRFQAEGDMVPLIFLHPGKEAPVIEGESRLIEESTATE